MDFVSKTHFNRQYRNERSIVDDKFEDHRLEKDFRIRENLSSYQQDSSRFEMDCEIKDLRVNKESLVNGSSLKVKEEMPPPPQRRYFCIFCKMDFLAADEFLDHLEMHPNGSFVLVKRDTVQPLPEPPEPEEASILSPILPEMLENQIKIEPISDDDDYQDYQVSEPVLSEASETNLNGNTSEPSETTDPNHQLQVLSNPRIGDGPGEYLCNVCNAKFVYKNNLKSHLKRHLGIYPYVCFCGKRYQFKCKLNKHIEQAHAKIKNFKCPVPTCPKKYFTRNDLAFHISVTHQERQEIPCNICNKVFNSTKSLQIHCRKYHRNQES